MQYLNAVSFAKKRIRNLAIFVVKKFIYKQHQILLHMYATITKEIVNEALQIGNTKIHNAIISLMYTSSLDIDAIINLKVGDLVKAYNSYFNEDEDQNIDVLLGKDTSDMYPCWVLDSGDKHRVTFNTPGASYYLFGYLKENAKYYDLDFRDFLFKTKPKGSDEYEGIKRAYITNLFNKKSNPLKELIITPDNFKFTTITFNKSFERICETYLNVDDKSELIDLFMGNATDDNVYYKQYLENPTSILEYYKKLLPYIELDNFMSSQQQVIKNPIPQEPVSSKKYDDEIISVVSNYYNKRLKDSTYTREKYLFLTDYVYDLIVNAKNLGISQDISKINFDQLFKRAEFNWALKQYPDNVSRDIDREHCEDDLFDAASILDELDIKDIVPIFPDLFVECLDEIINSDFQYTDTITIHESEYSQAFSCYLHKLDIQSHNSTYFNR